MQELNLEQLIAQYGWLATFGTVFLWGLLMNLTPCVYPMIPITVGYFGGMADGGRGRSAGMAVLFVLGMAVTYSLLGVSAALTGRLFGAMLGNAWVVGAITLVLVAMGSSMLGVWQMAAPSSLLTSIQDLRDRLGFVGSFFFGLVVGVVMTPCIGPAITALLAYVAGTRNPVLGFWLFFVLAMGMGLPYLLLGIFDGGLKALPRPGPWMVWLERLFGLVMIGMALFFWRPFMPGAAWLGIMSGYLVLCGVYLGLLERSGETGWPRFVLFKRVVGVALLGLGVYGVVGAVGLRAPATPSGVADGKTTLPTRFEWRKFSAAALDEARAKKLPVVIDFYATWCGACNELDEKTWVDAKVIGEGQRFVRLRMTVLAQEDLEKDRAAASFRITGLPTVIFLGADGREVPGTRIQEFVPPDRMVETMRKSSPP